ncbi:CCAAT/enhancer-binding protein delta [Carassius gibelio]|uniref:CCAAT/enhancer-binding protein delta n=1 Tax=Carassius gibelio TaxID=101364 RepID=UPI0022779E1C|nr:CCAAT/enhancer-binding protein delta [Carassius gibelio]
MSVSDSPPSSICMFALHHQSSSSQDSGLYGQHMVFPKTPDGRSMEQMMGFVPYSSCVTPSSSEREDFSQFVLPPPASTLHPSGQKRSPSKDSVEYRQRRERNNIAVRKSRDKARRRVQMTQQRALQLQDENQRLQLHIQHLSHEVDSLRHYLSQRHQQVREQDTAGEDVC